MKSSKTRQIVHPRKRHLTNDHFIIKKRDSTRTIANKHLPKNAFEYRETVFRVITLLQSKPKQKKGEFLSRVLRFSYGILQGHLQCYRPKLPTQSIEGIPWVLKYCQEEAAAMDHNISWDRLTQRLTFLLNSSLVSLHSFAASTFAGDSSLGLESIDMILKTILSTVWTGIQRSLASS